MRITRAKVEQAIRNKYGIDVELVKGNGYWYFIPADSWVLGCMGGTSIYTMMLGGVELNWWVEAFEDLFDGGCWDSDYIFDMLGIEREHPTVIKLSGARS